MMSMGWENKIPFVFDVLGPTVAEILELYSIRFGLKNPDLMSASLQSIIFKQKFYNLGGFE